MVTYFQDGSRARYSSKTGNTFSFGANTIGMVTMYQQTVRSSLPSPSLILGNFNNTSGIENSDLAQEEPDFGDQSLIDNGSTVNDRMFQGGSDVNQDYQLAPSTLAQEPCSDTLLRQSVLRYRILLRRTGQLVQDTLMLP